MSSTKSEIMERVKLIYSLILSAKKHSDAIIAEDLGPSPRDPFYRKEMRTFRMSGVRGLGYSTAATVLLQKFPDAILFLPLDSHLSIVRPMLKDPKFLNRIFVAGKEYSRGQGLDPQYIIMDMATYFTQHQREELEKLYPGTKPFWVELS